MGKKIALISMISIFAISYAKGEDHPLGVYNYDLKTQQTEAQQTDDLGTEVDQKVAKLIQQLVDKVNMLSDQISELQVRIAKLEKKLEE